MVQFDQVSLCPIGAPARPVLSDSKTEMGQVTVPDGDAAAGDQQAIDGGHQAAEQGAGGQEVDRCSLGHKRPLFLAGGTIPPCDLGIDYVYQMPPTTDLFA